MKTTETARRKFGMVRFRFLGVGYRGRLVASKYPTGNDRVDLEIRTAHKTWEPYAQLSVDVPSLYLPEGCFLARDWGVQKGLVQALQGRHLVISSRVTYPYQGFHLPVVKWVRSGGRSGTASGGKGTAPSPQ